MKVRLGLGPVFALESLLNARRWQVYAGRAFFVSMLLAGMAVTWYWNRAFGEARRPILTEMAEIGRWFFYVLTGIQVTLVLLAAPASAAGTIGMDRARGTLVHLLVTDLNDREIVLGSLAARIAPVWGMIVCGVPVLALAALLGGIDFAALAGAFVVSLTLAVLCCSLALTLSVWATKTHEVLMAVYLAESLWLLSLPIASDLTGGRVPARAWLTNPYFLVFAPYINPGSVGVVEFGSFVAAALAFSAALLGLSIARMRRVVVAQSGTSRERHVSATTIRPEARPPVLARPDARRQPRALARVAPQPAFAAGATALGRPHGRHLVARGLGDVRGDRRRGARRFGRTPDQLRLLFVLRAVDTQRQGPHNAGRGEATRQSRRADDLSLSTREIVVAKWWGAYRGVLILFPLVLYAGVFVSASWEDPGYSRSSLTMDQQAPATEWDRACAAAIGPLDFLASGAGIVSLGLLLATWIRRMGRAVAFSVIAYLAMGIGWIILVEVGVPVLLYYFFDSKGGPDDEARWLIDCLGSLSPLAGPLKPADELYIYRAGPRSRLWIGLTLVIAIKWAAALLLRWLTIKTFDRRLGRVSDSPRPVQAAGRAILAERPPVPSSL